MEYTKTEAVIDSKGCLQIKRGNEYKTQYCPFQVETSWCGTWCPLFGTVETTAFKYSEFRSFTLTLCHKTWVFDKLINNENDESYVEVKKGGD